MRILIKIIVASLWMTLCAGVISLLIISLWITEHNYPSVSSQDTYEYGIILGASVTPEGNLSYVLKSRVDAAVAYLQQGGIEKILVSGIDEEYYKEVSSVAKYLEQFDIASGKILLDPHGVDTYDSMWRASVLYNIDEAVIFTQHYHMSRSVYIARKLGIDAYAYPVDNGSKRGASKDYIREFFARIKAFVDVEVLNSVPANDKLD